MLLSLRKEEFSKAMVRAIAAQAGWNVASWGQDPWKMDTTLTKQVKLGQTGRTKVVTIDFQLKCTSAPTTDNKDFVSFSLDQEDFDAFKARFNSPRFMLGVMVVPDSETEWCNLAQANGTDLHAETRFRHCLYAKLLSHREKNELDISKTIRFAKGADELTHDSLKKIEDHESSLEKTISDVQAELAGLVAISSSASVTDGGANG